MLTELCEGKKLNFRVNPNEVVAYGATVLAASEKGLLPQDKPVKLIDVLP